MENLIRASYKPDSDIDIVLVISNRKNATGLNTAENLGVKTQIIEHEKFESRDAFELQLTSVLENARTEFICLAGFMRMLGTSFVDHWYNRLVNIHPSVLPAFKGLNTHQRAIEAGAHYSGCTVHFVRPDMDEGPIILQAITPVNTEDSAVKLSNRVLKLEHVCYPLALNWIAKGQISIVRGRVKLAAPNTHNIAKPLDQSRKEKA
tara:strand:+ start:953 stop:1570 length:618 start_codon:yes stop_codon:yes gene_type:complete